MSSIPINGVGNVLSQKTEYTSGAMLADYLAAMRILQGVLNQTSDSSTETTDVEGAIKTLKNLALNGVNSKVGSSNLTYYMTSDMIANMGAVFKSFSAAGISIGDFSTITPSSLSKWQNLSNIGISTILAQAVGVSSASTRTLQSMLELEFVRAGNQQIALQMQALSQALQVSQNALDTLNIIQGISNQISVSTSESFAFPPVNDYEISSASIAALQSYFNSESAGAGDGFRRAWSTDVSNAKILAANNPQLSWSGALSQQTTAAQYVGLIMTKHTEPQFTGNVYRIMASAHFSQIMPHANPTSTAGAQLLAAKNQLLQEIQTMQNLNIAYASTTNSLPSFMLQVASDISAYFSGVTSAQSFLNTSAQLQAASQKAVSQWILDNQNQKITTTGGGTAGAIQSRITQAINAAQSLNDTEKAHVQTAEYNFQQFYQSAGNVLQSINQIMTSVAQGISGQ